MRDNKILNVVIVHGSNKNDRENIKKYGLASQNERHWFLWLKNELEKRGIECINPLMPENWNPKYPDWKEEFEKIKIDEDSILVGYSLGATFLVKWLGNTKKEIKKLILVAPAKVSHEGSDYIKEFYDFEINENIKNNIREITIIQSNDDHDYILKSSRIYKKALGGKIIELPGRGHFTETSMGTKEFPELMDEILK